MTPITSKAQFNKLSQRGLLGNFLRKFDSLGAAHASGSKWFTIRGIESQFKFFVPDVSKSMLRIACQDLSDHGQTAGRDYYIQEIPEPGTPRIINFEVRPNSIMDGESLKGSPDIDDFRMWLVYGNTPTQLDLRTDLIHNGKILRGLEAKLTLQHYLDHNYERLEHIWEQYPGHTIEATLYPRPCGAFHEQLVIWEVRSY